MGFLVLALAQPRWGLLPVSPLPPGQDVVIVIDVSRSMGAEDAVPNRLGAAVDAAEGLLATLGRSPGDRAAVVAFAGRAVVRCPLTETIGAASDVLRSLRPGEVQPGGTDLGAALTSAFEVFDQEPRAEGRTIVLFSDGEDHAGRWQRALNSLKGVVVHAVALGDADEGAKVPSASGEPITYQGQTVVSRRTDEPLRTIAQGTGGAFLPLGLARVDLGRLYRDRIAPLARRERMLARVPERAEQYSLFVFMAMVLGLVGSWPRPWRLPLAAALVLVATAGSGPNVETAADAVAAGKLAYNAGQFDRALAAFEHASRLDPRSAIARYNAAATLYQVGRYTEAAALYRQVRDQADPGLRAKIDYALGNTMLALGKASAAIRHYDACLAAKVAGPPYDALRRDARINRQFAARHRPPRPPSEPDEGPGRRSPTSTPRPVSPDKQSQSTPSPSGAGSPAPTDPGQATPPSPPAPSGAGPDAPDVAESPEARLDAALARVEQARRRRLPESPPPPPSDEHKDW
ncbi:MAG: VWA domain-containing protein [Isosphaeraceae bacterium]